MKRAAILFGVLALAMLVAFAVYAEKESTWGKVKAELQDETPSPMAKKTPKPDCTTIQDGVLTYSAGHYLAGQPLETGYDPYGSNYQGRMFDGSYANNYLGRDGFPPYEGDDVAYLADNPGAASTWYWPYREVRVLMKWNDAWISNKDCGGDDGAPPSDGALDRHYGYPTYIGSGAWLTNHQSGEYVDDDGNTCKWNYFVKIVAVPADAALNAGVWYTSDGGEIGPSIWGQFAIIQHVENDPCADIHGTQCISPIGPGFGKFKP